MYRKRGGFWQHTVNMPKPALLRPPKEYRSNHCTQADYLGFRLFGLRWLLPKVLLLSSTFSHVTFFSIACANFQELPNAG